MRNKTGQTKDSDDTVKAKVHYIYSDCMYMFEEDTMLSHLIK